MEESLFVISDVRNFCCCVAAAVGLLAGSAQGGTIVRLAWDANQEQALAGYRVYWGLVSRGTNTHPEQFGYGNTKVVPAGETSTMIRELPLNQTNYITVTAFDTQGAESFFGNEIVYVAPDADCDGIKDSWERQYGLNPLAAGDAARDDDGDRMSNYEEYLAGTNPRSKWSRLVCEVRRTSAGIVISWQGVLGRLYTLERCASLAGQQSFAVARSRIEGWTGGMAHTNPATMGRKFYTYRVRVE